MFSACGLKLAPTVELSSNTSNPDHVLPIEKQALGVPYPNVNMAAELAVGVPVMTGTRSCWPLVLLVEAASAAVMLTVPG